MPDIRKRPPLTYAQKEAQRRASLQLMQMEDRIDMENKLPPALRTTGELGLFAQAALGGDRELGPAKMIAVGMPKRGENQLYSNRAGEYRLPGTGTPTIQSEYGDSPLSDRLMWRRYYGGKPTQPDEITFFNPTEWLSKEHQDQSRRGVPQTALFHEPTHRAYNMPFMKDFKSYLQQRSSDAGGTGRKRREYDFIRSHEHAWLNPARRQHLGELSEIYKDTEEDINRMARDDKRTLATSANVQKLFAEWLTPELQQKYGMYPIIQAVQPKEKPFYERWSDPMVGPPERESRSASYEQLLDGVEKKDETDVETDVMDKIYGLIGRLTN